MPARKRFARACVGISERGWGPARQVNNDVIIVGAGPAGAVAATVLARAGARVRLLDRSAFPRDKLCGDTVNPGTLAVLRRLGLRDDAEHVNPNGGAIALGHPLGMSGARLALTATHQLEKTGGKLGLATLCVGVGQGAALALERVG
jgi:threonine dehydrogenase-like Zn-dependent dehydrogenase